MAGDPARRARYQIIVRGELGDRFMFLFEGMQLARAAGLTTLTGAVADQAHLHGLIARTYDLGLELVSVAQVDE
jgi:hypothetical protein